MLRLGAKNNFTTEPNLVVAFPCIGWPVLFRIALILLLEALAVDAGRAADIPPPNVLASILSKLAPRSIEIEFTRTAAQPNPSCRMQPNEMRFVDDSGRTVGSYSVLLEGQSSNPAIPRDFFAVLSRVTVDTDGSPHTYHPEDPEGKGTCQRVRDNNQELLDGICPIEKFTNGDAHVFLNENELSGGDLATKWGEMWPLVRNRQLKSVNMASVGGSSDRYMFYWEAGRLAAIFNRSVIPHDKDGYPCTQDRDSAYAGYFIAATTLKQIGPTREDGCAPQHNLDSEMVPYFALPKGKFGEAHVGDVVIAQFIQNATSRTVFGIVGDVGGSRLGEGSVAFNAALLGRPIGPMASLREAWGLDIGYGKAAVLVLGGSRRKLNGLYTPNIISEVAGNELMRWGGGDAMRRFEACTTAANVNGKH